VIILESVPITKKLDDILLIRMSWG